MPHPDDYTGSPTSGHGDNGKHPKKHVKTKKYSPDPKGNGTGKTDDSTKHPDSNSRK